MRAQLLSVGLSLASYVSQLRLWQKFCTMRQIDLVPAQERHVLEYIGLFDNGRSAAKYVCALRFLHDLLLASRQGVDAASVRRALQGLLKAAPPVRQAPAISPDEAARISAAAFRRGDVDFALVAVLSSAFLFRVGNECLPLEFSGTHSRLSTTQVEGRSAIRVELASRKNAPGGAVLTRPCSCRGGQVEVVRALVL